MTNTILITGVSSGTGLGLAEKFLAQGYQVAGSVRTREQAEALRTSLGDQFIPLVFDITEPEQVRAAADELRSQWGVEHLAAIVNNAGSATIGPLLHVSADEFRQQLDVLVVGQLNVIQGFFGFLRPARDGAAAGRIINMSSVSGVGHNFLFGTYAAGKHALEGLSKTLRKECAMYGIKVVSVAPGNIATAIWDKQTKDGIEKYRGTDYYDLLNDKLDGLDSDVVRKAMTVDEFADAFYEVFDDADPADRYTIVKSKNRKNPFSKLEVRVLRS
jgi:NAD(P)-dependent dehydrogenase (short-subunit alcohol dehydrogenase family)